MIVVNLPWPPHQLNPNKRLHWSRKSRAARLYRNMCYVLTKNEIQSSDYHFAGTSKMVFSIEFCPPDNRRRDDDNMLASFKAGRDGVADALGVDDNKFVTSFEVCDPVPDGSVRVTVKERDQ